jgi:hypothetical protein
MDYTKEKEIATWKHHPMAIASTFVSVAVGADDELAVAVPFDRRCGSSVS